jgi:hypothetical protein
MKKIAHILEVVIKQHLLKAPLYYMFIGSIIYMLIFIVFYSIEPKEFWELLAALIK